VKEGDIAHRALSRSRFRLGRRGEEREVDLDVVEDGQSSALFYRG
jgi:hypothetical protein